MGKIHIHGCRLQELEPSVCLSGCSAFNDGMGMWLMVELLWQLVQYFNIIHVRTLVTVVN